jgi:hypothetical protein
VADRFSLAGELANLASTNPDMLVSLRKKYVARSRTIGAALPYALALHLALLNAFPVSVAAMLVSAWVFIGAFVILKIENAYVLRLLTPAKDLNVQLDIDGHCHDCGAALAWIQSVARSGRQLFGFDVEIMSMMSQAHLLAKT